MKAFVLTDYSQPPRLTEISIPEPKNNEVLIKVAYCGINRVDLAVLSGRFKGTAPLPLIMGSEIVGTLANGKKVAVNPYLHCDKCKYCLKKEYLVCEKGRPLLGVQQNGGYAEYVSAPKDNVISIPSGVSLEHAAASVLSAGTAYRMVTNKAEIKKGDWVTVTAAGSGVGVYSCQFARLAGGKVIAAAGNDTKLKQLKQLGIKNVINYTKSNWQDNISKITNNHGVDALIDTVGGSILTMLIPYIASLGRIVLCGATENPNISLSLIHLYMKQVNIMGSSGFMNDDLIKVFQLAKQKKIKPIIDSVYTLTDIPKAWDKLKSRNVFGKILIKIPGV